MTRQGSSGRKGSSFSEEKEAKRLLSDKAREGDEASFLVHLTPRGGRDAVEGWAEDAAGRPCLRVRVAAPPVEGAANAALLALIAKRLALPRRAVRLVSGEHGRQKRLLVEGVAQTELRRSLLPD